MTEQEAFNDPEMKTIILLSGYVRELGEGKDYETTTYKLAETLVKVFSIHHVSQQSELLFCGGCGNKRQLIVETDINSQRICKNKLCKQNNCG